MKIMKLEELKKLTNYKKMTMRIFISVTHDIIKSEGLESVTIRKIAEKSGYNSATIYNYFENAQHLITLASISFLEEYVASIPKYTENDTNSLEEFFSVWRCFIDFSSVEYEIYYNLFFMNIEKNASQYFTEYYFLFPVEEKEFPAHLRNMLIYNDMSERNKVLMKKCETDGYLKIDDLDMLNDVIIFIYEGLLHRIYNGKITGQQMKETFDNHIKEIMKPYVVNLDEKE